jgi:hypothetical protein
MHAFEGAIAMRRILWITATAAILAFPASALCQQPDQQRGEHAAQPPPPTTLEKQKEAPKPPPPPAGAERQAQPPAATSIPPNPPKESLGEAARRAREQKRDAGKSGRVFTNDNLPTGGVSTVGVLLAPARATAETAPAAAGENAAPNDEKTWRARFAKLRDKLAKDQAELEVMQRELGVLDLQAYDDPVKGLQQNLTRSDINTKTAKIEDKKKQIEEDQQTLSDAEDQLRKSGGDAGWAR